MTRSLQFFFVHIVSEILHIFIVFTFLSKISSSLLTLIELKRPFNLNKEKHYGHFLWMWFNCLKATEPLHGDSLV